MKRILYLDCFSGISGDMFLGALLDLGVDLDLIKMELAKLGLDSEYHLTSEKTTRSGIAGTSFCVNVLNAHHDHAHPAPDHEHVHGRTYDDIKKLIERSGLSPAIKKQALAVFLEIGSAEAAVHAVPLEQVHFHEVGAVDSIVDIVGGAIALDALKIDQVITSPISDGSGTIRCQHGVMPVPVPAVMKMLEGTEIPYITGTSYTELVTPTGLGLAKTLTSVYGSMPVMRPLTTGYGFGQRNIGRLNALRVIVGEVADLGEAAMFSEQEIDHVMQLSCHIDNATPEELGFLMDRLFSNGAVDVVYSPLMMKKNRPGQLLTVLVPLSLEKQIAEVIFSLSGTIGIRRQLIERHIMRRKMGEIEVDGFKIRMKQVNWQNIERSYPEYEDLAEFARQKNLSLPAAQQLIQRRILSRTE